MDPDLNKYDLEHAVHRPSEDEQRGMGKALSDAWKIYYTPEHIETILRRAQAYEINILRLAQIILWFASSVAVERLASATGRLPPAHQSS